MRVRRSIRRLKGMDIVTEEPRATVRSVERALDILEVLAKSDGPIRLVDLCRSCLSLIHI